MIYKALTMTFQTPKVIKTAWQRLKCVCVSSNWTSNLQSSETIFSLSWPAWLGMIKKKVLLAIWQGEKKLKKVSNQLKLSRKPAVQFKVDGRGHLSSLDNLGSPPGRSVNWVIKVRGTPLSGDLLTHMLSARVVQRSSIKHLQHG